MRDKSVDAHCCRRFTATRQKRSLAPRCTSYVLRRQLTNASVPRAAAGVHSQSGAVRTRLHRWRRPHELAQLVAAELARLSAQPMARDEVQYSSPHPGLDPHAIAWYLQNTRVEGAWLMQ